MRKPDPGQTRNAAAHMRAVLKPVSISKIRARGDPLYMVGTTRSSWRFRPIIEKNGVSAKCSSLSRFWRGSDTIRPRGIGGLEYRLPKSVESEHDAQRDITVLICSDAPLESEANASIRGSIRDGWVDHLSGSRVFSTRLDSVMAAIDMIRPDLVLCVGSYLPETAYFGEATRAAHAAGAVAAFWATEDPYEKDASYRIEHGFDAIFTCDRWTRRFYDHPRVFHLPLAGCPHRHHVPICEDAERPIDMLFCGVAFANRREIIAQLMPALEGLRIAIIGPGWGGQDRGASGAGFSEQRLDKRRLIGLYAQSKIVLNLGRSLNFENARYQIAPSTPGPRTFEAAMAGALQFFHEDTLEIRDYFEEDEIPGFSGSLDFRRLLDRFLPAGDLRARTSRRAQQRALAEHSYARRAQRMADILFREGLL